MSCSAPLEFEGNAMQKCGFCGVNVIVPPEVFYIDQQSRRVQQNDPNVIRAEKLAEIMGLIAQGQKIHAIKGIRDIFGLGLADAKSAVDSLERGESVDLSSLGHRSQGAQGVRISSGGPVIPAEAARTAAKAAGGSLIVGLLAVVSLAVAGAVMFFSFSADEPEPVASGTETMETVGSAAGGESQGISEVMRIGGRGTGAGKFQDNRVVAVDGDGRIFSGDYNGGRIQSFDAKGEFLDVWTLGDGILIFDLAASRRGRVYLLTQRGIRAFESETGKEIASVDDRYGRGLAVGLDGRVYLAGRKGIAIYDADLKLIRELPKAGDDASSSLGFEKIAVDGIGNMFMIERASRDIIKFSSDGKFLNRIPTDEGGGSANAIAIDPAGRIYISKTSSINIYSPEGRSLVTIKANQAFGMAFNSAGELFVASRPEIVKKRFEIDQL